MKKIMMSALVASSLALAGGDIAPAEPVAEPVIEETSAWQQEFTLYGWLPTIDAETRWGAEISTDTSDMTSDIIDDLKMGFIGTYAVRHNKWSFVADIMYVDLGDSKTETFTHPVTGLPGQADIDMDIKTMLVNTGIGYNIIQNENTMLDVVAGIRYMGLKVDLGVNDRSKSLDEDIVDGIIGLRGRYKFNGNWFIPYYADIGAGDSDLTYQLFAGIGYSYDWGNVELGYRYVGYEMADDMLIEDLNLYGAVLGVTFKF